MITDSYSYSLCDQCDLRDVTLPWNSSRSSRQTNASFVLRKITSFCNKSHYTMFHKLDASPPQQIFPEYKSRACGCEYQSLNQLDILRCVPTRHSNSTCGYCKRFWLNSSHQMQIIECTYGNVIMQAQVYRSCRLEIRIAKCPRI